jgi:hypothetical protein
VSDAPRNENEERVRFYAEQATPQPAPVPSEAVEAMGVPCTCPSDWPYPDHSGDCAKSVVRRLHATTLKHIREIERYEADLTTLEAALSRAAKVEEAAKADAAIIADLVNGIRWWAAQEDGIPSEVWDAFGAAMLRLGWSFSTPTDLAALREGE